MDIKKPEDIIDMPDDKLDEITINKLQSLLENEEDSNSSNTPDNEVITVNDDDSVDISSPDNDLSDNDNETEGSDIDTELSDDTSDNEDYVDQDNNTEDEEESNQESEDQEPSEEEDVQDNTDEDITDYKSAYEEVKNQLSRILSPFKANGKMIQVDSVDDAIQLMQMGANYSEKMAKLKPYLKIVKTLENEGLLDEEKINLLVEAGKGKPEAIKKLVAEYGIDTFDFDPDKDKDYKPDNHQVSDKVVELEMVIEQLSQDPQFNDTLDKLLPNLDESSKQAITENPVILQTLHQHVVGGIFDQVAAQVAKMRALGQLPLTTSFVEAYAAVLQQMQQQGAFNNTQNTTKEAQRVKPKKAKPSNVRKKKSAAPVRSNAGNSNTSISQDDILNMSDEEFEKVSQRLFKTI